MSKLKSNYKLQIVLLVIGISLQGCFAQERTVSLKTLSPQSELTVKAPTERGFTLQGLIFENNTPFLAYYSNYSSILKLIGVEDSKTTSFDLRKSIDSIILKNETLGDIILINSDSIVLLYGDHLIGISKNKLLFNKQINIGVYGK